MAITRVKVSNFKGFRDLEIDLGAFNVLIGANAAGKSSFIQIFQFLKDLINHGLDNAISMQGGGEYFRNMSLGPSRSFSLEVTSNTPLRGETAFRDPTSKDRSPTKGYRFANVLTKEIMYNIVVAFEEKGEKLKAVEEQLTLVCDFSAQRDEERLPTKSKRRPTNSLGTGKIIIKNDGQELDTQFIADKDSDLTHLEIDMYPFGAEDLDASNFPPGAVLRGTIPLTPLFIMRPYPYEALSKIAIYDFDPRLPKKAVQIAGRVNLEADGSNLALVLKNILEDEEEKRKFSNLIRDVLPFVDDLRIEKFADKSLFFELKESYYENGYLPASLLSDGTINVTALIIALYFEQNPLTIIEEPERNIHPSLIARVIDMMKEVGQKRQIIVSTHNPEMVKHSDLDSLLLVARDDEGFSTVFRPAERETVRSFLEGEMGVEELYIRNLLAL